LRSSGFYSQGKINPPQYAAANLLIFYLKATTKSGAIPRIAPKSGAIPRIAPKSGAIIKFYGNFKKNMAQYR
jgi:hypothetical protein